MANFDFILNDRRIMDQRLRRHWLSQTEYQKYLKNLPDDKDQAEETPVFREGNRNPARSQTHSG